MLTLYDAGRCPFCARVRIMLAEKGVEVEQVEERYPGPALLPLDPSERALARVQIFRFERLSSPYYALRRGEESARPELESVLAELDALLEAQPYITGRAYGLADIAYVPWVFRAQTMLQVDRHPWPALTDWADRLLERPAIVAEADVVAAL